jgi:thymidine kinase
MSLEVVIGPMFAGKTTHAISLVHKYRAIGKTVLVIKPALDTRYGYGSMLYSHTGDTLPCMNVSTLNSITNAMIAAYDVFILDESQFFNGLIGFVEDLVERFRKTVFVIGLSGDYARRPFGQILDLIPLADKVTNLSALCACGKEAHFTQRLTPNTGQVIVGAGELYKPVCRVCFSG